MKLIVAVDQNGGIGCNGKIPWSCPEDQRFFRFITMGERVYMGRATYDSLSKPLSGRYNFVVTHSKEDLRQGFHKTSLQMMYLNNEGFVIGGQMLYEDALSRKKVETIYISRISGLYECDRFFDMPAEFRKVSHYKLSEDCTVEKWII